MQTLTSTFTTTVQQVQSNNWITIHCRSLAYKTAWSQSSCSFDRPGRTGDVLKLQVVLLPGRAKTGTCDRGRTCMMSSSVSASECALELLVRNVSSAVLSYVAYLSSVMWYRSPPPQDNLVQNFSSSLKAASWMHVCISSVKIRKQGLLRSAESSRKPEWRARKTERQWFSWFIYLARNRGLEWDGVAAYFISEAAEWIFIKYPY